MKALRGMLAAAATVLLLVGCTSTGTTSQEAVAGATTPEGDTAASPSTPIVTPSVETPTPSATSSHPPIVLPSCEDANPSATERALLFEERRRDMDSEFQGVRPAGFEWFESFAGPVAQNVLANAVQATGCQYVIHLEVAYFQWTAELLPEEQALLLEQLRADPEFSELQLGDATTFSFLPDGYFHYAYYAGTYIFVDDIWIAVFEQIPHLGVNEENVQPLLDALNEANPWLEASTAQ